MNKQEFINELVKRVKTNASELLDLLDGVEESHPQDSFSDWLHYITDGRNEILFLYVPE